MQTLTKIFDRESDWRHERFSYRPVAIYLKTTKDGQWFFPDKTDRRLFMTGDPGADTQLIGIKISEEESQIVEELIQKYASCV